MGMFSFIKEFTTMKLIYCTIILIFFIINLIEVCLHTLKPKNHNREKNGKTESAASNRCYTKRCSIKSCCNIATLCFWIKILKNEM